MYVHHADRERVASAIEDAVERGAPFDVECRVVPAGGRARGPRAASVDRDEDGAPACCAAARRTSPSSARPSGAAMAAATREAAAREHRDRRRAAAQPAAADGFDPSTSRWRPTTAPASRAPRSAATGTTSSSSAPGAPRS
jgi:hypothetical protein